MLEQPRGHFPEHRFSLVEDSGEGNPGSSFLFLFWDFLFCAFQGISMDPTVLKTLRRVNFGTVSEFRYGHSKTLRRGLRHACSSIGKRGRKTVQRVKNYGGSKILRIQLP